MPVRFEIEFVNKDRRPYYLIARHITPGHDFSLLEMPFLNGFKVKPELTMPRALDKNGLPGFDLFVFYLADGNDIKKFNTGTIVELTAEQT